MAKPDGKNLTALYDAKKGERAFSRVSEEMQASPAFHNLTAPGIRLLLYAIKKQYQAATTRAKNQRGAPTFKMTNQQALEDLGMHPAKFTRAKIELAEKGFIQWEVRGGLHGANGVPSEYGLSGEWKKWIPAVAVPREPPKRTMPYG